MSGAPSTSAADVVSGLAAFPAGLRVLVVDDDLLCLKVVEKMLKTCGYTGACDGDATRCVAHDARDH